MCQTTTRVYNQWIWNMVIQKKKKKKKKKKKNLKKKKKKKRKKKKKKKKKKKWKEFIISFNIILILLFLYIFSYLIIGALTKLPIFYNYNNIETILINDLLFEADNLTNTQWKNLINILFININ